MVDTCLSPSKEAELGSTCQAVSQEVGPGGGAHLACGGDGEGVSAPGHNGGHVLVHEGGDELQVLLVPGSRCPAPVARPRRRPCTPHQAVGSMLMTELIDHILCCNVQ